MKNLHIHLYEGQSIMLQSDDDHDDEKEEEKEENKRKNYVVHIILCMQ